MRQCCAEPFADQPGLLTVGAQFAWWGDYQKSQRLQLFFKWHVVMPVLTALCGYFPGQRLGSLEYLPKGVANEWSLRRCRFERSYPKPLRAGVLDKLAALNAPILAVVVSDDPLAPEPAIRRGLAYDRVQRRRWSSFHRAIITASRSGILIFFTTAIACDSGRRRCCGCARGGTHGPSGPVIR